MSGKVDCQGRDIVREGTLSGKEGTLSKERERKGDIMKGSIKLVFNKLFEFQLCSDVYSLVTGTRSTSLSGYIIREGTLSGKGHCQGRDIVRGEVFREGTLF